MNRRLEVMDIHAALRRLRAGESIRRVAQALRVDRKTVSKYRDWAQAQGLLEGDLPDLAGLHARLAATWGAAPPPQNRSSVEAYRDDIQRLLDQGLGARLIHQKLAERPEFTCSEAAVWRLTKKLRQAKAPEAVGRLETPPGEVAQVDFGEVSRLVDPATGELRRTWALSFVLGWSRHMYVELVFDQQLPTWLAGHQRAFEFFGGVPKRLVIDNHKPATLACAPTSRTRTPRCSGRMASVPSTTAF
jgi:transposase